MDNAYEFEGFKDLADIVSKYVDGAENAMEGIKAGAIEFVNDLLKLPKPMSKIRKAGYTHLVRSFSWRERNNEIEAGKIAAEASALTHGHPLGIIPYYGPMVENGAKQMKTSHPHVYPLWDKKKEKYYKTMLTKLGITTW